MSAEPLALALIVEEGAAGLRKAYHAGISAEDFFSYEDEFAWVEDRISKRKPVNPRLFRQAFPDFEWLLPNERLQDLLEELKNERAFADLTTMIEGLASDLVVDNAFEQVQFLRERLSEMARGHSVVSDHALISDWKTHMANQKRLRNLRLAGEPPGIPTAFENINFHWDGLVPGRFIVVLGRPGDAKSYLVGSFAAHASKLKHRVLLFSPEMNRHEHTCRIHTLLSADPDVKKALGLKNSFRNRALMHGIGYNPKSYMRFQEYLAAEFGEIVLMTQTNRRMKMSVGFIEAKIADMGPDLVIVDPIYKLAATKDRKSRTEELSDISDAIQDLAESYNIPIVVTNQAHRQMSGKDDAPHKDNSFNSDVPIQEADHVIGVKNNSEERLLRCRCSKSRFGADFRFESRFHPNTGVIKELTKPNMSYLNGSDDEGIEDEELEQMVATAKKG